MTVNLRFQTWHWLILALLLGPAIANTRAADDTNRVPATRLWWFPSVKDWDLVRDETTDTVSSTSPVLTPAFLWSEAIVSWNVPTNTRLTVEAAPDGRAHWFVLGHWSADTNAGPRTSVTGQQDAWGRVDTDTLVAAQPATRLQVRLRVPLSLRTSPEPSAWRVGVCFLAAQEQILPPPPQRSAWGRKLDVPILSQADYPEGVQNWCSPTSLTMVLRWWRAHGLEDIPAWDVREVAQGVNDPGWPGTGNWPFNMAFAGQQPGLHACLARWAGLGDIETWIMAGRPVVASVSYAQLKGAPNPLPGDGHLVVVTGFSPEGDVEINDPGVRRERVAKVVPRAVFERAWAHSRRTVYLVWPARAGTPTGGGGRW